MHPSPQYLEKWRLSDACESTNRVKKGVIKELLFEIGAFLVTCFVCTFPPYFDHDAFRHHPIHVLDAPA